MRYWVDRRIEWLSGRLLPPRCVLCGGAGQRPSLDLCHACERSLPLAEPAMAHGPSPLQACFAPWVYRYPVDHLVHALKYRGQLAVARVLGVLLGRRLAARRDRLIDVVVPVPLHPRRHAERGFNQSAEIARWTARVLRCPVEARLAARCRDTPPQVGLRGAERRCNLEGAFAAGSAVRGLRVALVDDVVTTGATLAALARALNAAGAHAVEAWCVGRVASPKRVNSALDLEVPLA